MKRTIDGSWTGLPNLQGQDRRGRGERPVDRRNRPARHRRPPFRADVNGAWTPGTARRQLEKLRRISTSPYIEQPLELDDLDGHAELRKVLHRSVALDESAYTLADVGNIVRMNAADVVLLDPHEAGGLWQT